MPLSSGLKQMNGNCSAFCQTDTGYRFMPGNHRRFGWEGHCMTTPSGGRQKSRLWYRVLPGRQEDKEDKKAGREENTNGQDENPAR
jgi:hypothetical protein